MSIKIVAVGDGAVGKTCMLMCYTKDEFPEEYVPTVFENYSKTIRVNDEDVLVSLWDTAGQEEYESIRPLSYPSTDVFLLCYSVVERVSLKNIAEKWYNEIKHYCPSTPRLIVGLKSDLKNDEAVLQKLKEKNQSVVTVDDVYAFIDEKKMLIEGIYECSAKERIGLNEVFEAAVKVVLGNSKKDDDGDVSQNESGEKKKKKTCLLL